jgi:hypothetical protein
VPWQSLAKNTHKYCDDSVFPNGFTFLDPIKLKIEPATLLLDHWFQRQTDTQPPFMFKGATVAVAKGKKSDYVELDEEDEETDEEEEETDEEEDEVQTRRHQKGKGKVAYKEDTDEEESDNSQSEEPSTSASWPRGDPDAEVDELTSINKAEGEEVEQEQEQEEGQEGRKDEEGNENVNDSHGDVEARHMMSSDEENEVDDTGNGEPARAASKRKSPHDSELAID